MQNLHDSRIRTTISVNRVRSMLLSRCPHRFCSLFGSIIELQRPIDLQWVTCIRSKETVHSLQSEKIMFSMVVNGSVLSTSSRSRRAVTLKSEPNGVSEAVSLNEVLSFWSYSCFPFSKFEIQTKRVYLPSPFANWITQLNSFGWNQFIPINFFRSLKLLTISSWNFQQECALKIISAYF